MEGFLAGNISGLAQIVIGHPLDTYKVWLQSGVRPSTKPSRLYRGIKYPLYASCIQNSVIFGVNYNLSQSIENQWLTGYLTGIAMSLVCCPVEHCKIRKQNNLPLPSLRKLRLGFGATFFRETISCSIYFGSFNYLNKKTDNIPLSGGLAGVLCWLPTYPFDSIKTKIQSGQHTNYRDAIKAGGLWKGIGVCCLRGFIANSLGFWVYYRALDFCQNYK